MEIAKRSVSKAQLMSITALVFVFLMFSALLVFVIVGISYDSTSQSASASLTSGNYGLLLQKSADSFAYQSGTAALNTLFKYEYNSMLRKDNFISNFTQYMQYLMSNGMLPNVPPGSSDARQISNMMGSLTFSAYNDNISAVTGTGSTSVNMIETTPQISQTNPYSISIKYSEYLRINSSSGTYSFTIPVNVSIPLNNTPDLFFAQQGIYRPIKFAGTSGLATVIGGDYATYGNTSGFVYGTVYAIPSPTSCSFSAIPSSFQSPPYSTQLIIVTPDADKITSGCPGLSAYGGLITDNAMPNPDINAYLVYNALTSNVLQYLETGQHALLYGPALTTLNITNLINAVNSNKYFASPFAPSYISRTEGDFQNQSAEGMYTFSLQDSQALSFNSLSQYNLQSTETQASVVGYTVAAWVYPTSQNGIIISDRGSGTGHGLILGIGNVLECGGMPGSFFFGDNGNGVGLGSNTIWQYPMNRWYFVAGTFNAPTGGSISSSDFNLYINGVPSAKSSWCNIGSDTAPLTGSGGMYIGTNAPFTTSQGGVPFNGLLSNMQVYNSVLSQQQIYHLYQEGIGGVPISNTMLLGWYPFDGNLNDYGGNGYTVTSQVPANFVVLPGYVRDGILTANASQYSFPIPGLENCNTNIQCANYNTPHLYLGGMPLGISNGGMSAAYFNGQTSYFEQGAGFNSFMSASQPFSMSIWVDPFSLNGVIINELGQRQELPGTWQDTFMELYKGNVYVNVWTSGGNVCNRIGSIPAGQWSNIVLTYSGSGYSLSGYINYGASNTVHSVVRAVPPPANSMFYPLGLAAPTTYCGSESNPPGAPPFYGYMSNYQVYDTALSQQQVSQLYSEGLSGTPVAPGNIIGWWPLNGNLNDYTSNQNTGVGNSLSFAFLPTNYGQYSTTQSASQNSVGLSNPSATESEWQAMGFPTQSSPLVFWNVTAWVVPSEISSPPSSPTVTPSSAVANQLGGWYSGIVGGDQQWNFATTGPILYYSGSFNHYFQAQPSFFPNTLSMLNNNNPVLPVGYTAVTSMYLSGTYNFEIAVDDDMEVYYRPISGGSWTQVFGGAAWPSGGEATTKYGPVSVTFTSGMYQIAVVYQNIEYAGVSEFSMSPQN